MSSGIDTEATRPLRLSDFDYDLPRELIAQVPSSERTGSRLLHVDGAAQEDLAFTELPRLVAPGDLLVFNDTRVIKSRLAAVKSTGGKVELMLERLLGHDRALFQLRVSHPPKIGGELALPGGARATVIDRPDRFFELRLEGGDSFLDYLDRHGAVPLPPYIARAAGADDESRYQTVFARQPGAVAAPTAGLHFDAALIATLEAKGVAVAWVTLHVGAGTFAPVTTEDLSAHVMHSEWYRVPAATAAAVDATRARGGRVLAVGTTSVRALESAASPDGLVTAGEGETRIFIMPGYTFRTVDRLLTNFHLPKSTLLMLVSAFAGVETIRAAYAHAIAKRYRFFSYGDAMLLERDAGLQSGR
ncbi:MAG: tRNA preQ1(34) S-adenosylmethionine ribosyltransferase-isomerase QueA [Casimicrobiaceae bacterium]